MIARHARLLSTGLLLLAVVLPRTAAAQDGSGPTLSSARVGIAPADVSRDAVALSAVPARASTFPRDSVSERRPSVWAYVGIGLLAGAAAGYAVGKALDNAGSCADCYFDNALLGVPIGAAVGAGIGAVVWSARYER